MNRGMKIIADREILGRGFRIYGTPDEPYFLAKDVAEFLGHNQPSRLVDLVDRDEKKIIIVNTERGLVKRWLLTESGLYEVLMCSRKKVAKVFRREVKAILKEIRREGMYVREGKLNEMLENPDIMINALQKIKESRDEIKCLNEALVKQKPKVLFADAVNNIGETILVGELAKLICQNGVDIGQNRLYSWLRANNYLIRRRGRFYNMPTQKAMKSGLFKIKETLKNRKDGYKEIRQVTQVTGKGQIYFINKFVDEAIIY